MSQKELERLLTTDGGTFNADDLTKMKARLEVVGDFEDLKNDFGAFEKQYRGPPMRKSRLSDHHLISSC